MGFIEARTAIKAGGWIDVKNSAKKGSWIKSGSSIETGISYGISAGLYVSCKSKCIKNEII